ncbi:MAG TPA: hypothetical protein VHM70_06140 [Polyangiaceae bacterium]|jgi:hypothetical protein|nr:hypothetical protein [Polyangiaceae bacterium]
MRKAVIYGILLLSAALLGSCLYDYGDYDFASKPAASGTKNPADAVPDLTEADAGGS